MRQARGGLQAAAEEVLAGFDELNHQHLKI
jgi:hypothetical protein